MKPIFKWTLLVVATCATTAVVSPRLARSADHLDGPAVKMDATTDIADLYSWVDGSNVVFVMTVNPAAADGAKFSDAAQYVFHTSSAATFGGAATDANIICQFDAAQKAECWVGADDYVTGDATAATGIASASGKVKVFAGIRKDPFFFNLDGLNATREAVKAAAPNLQFDTAGCPTVDGNTSHVLVTQLKTSPDGGAPVDHFADFKALAIVVSVDKSLLTKGGPIVASWASTNKKS